MPQRDNYITEEKKKALEQELKDLKGPRRKEILEALEYAKSLGDLSENAEYHQVREDQGKLEARIAKIEQILSSSLIAKASSGGDIINIGSKVKVLKDGDTTEKEYLIVGAEEASMKEGKLSNNSPFGQALFGKRKGDKVKFTTPGGEANYKIIDVA